MTPGVNRFAVLMQLSEQHAQPAAVVLRRKSRWLFSATFLAGLVAGIGVFAIVDYFSRQTLAGVAQTTAGIVDRLASVTFESQAVPVGSIVTESDRRIAQIVTTLAVRRFSDSARVDSVYIATSTAQFAEGAAQPESVYVGFVRQTHPLVIDLRRSSSLPTRRPRGYLLVPGTNLIPVF
jgi:hypothetical protein